ncbi:MAG: hypothetical protein HQK99_10475 [Nitrospirae bacterium]|nr:hypothetical protein [Nitrospirota bacterium]
MKRLVMILLILTVPCLAFAAEVKNLKVSNAGYRVVADYDLMGAEGEEDAEVTVAITIGTETRTSDTLHLTGDFGMGVKVGKGKSIVWDVVKDVPADFDGDGSWYIKASAPPVSLELTLKFIREKLSEKTEFNYVSFFTDTTNNRQLTNSFEAKIWDFKIGEQNCLLSYRFLEKRGGQTAGRVPKTIDAAIAFRDVIKTEILTMVQLKARVNPAVGRPNLTATQTNPELFVIVVTHRGGVVNYLYAEDHETAARIQKAINNAVVLCGGGEKGAPF